MEEELLSEEHWCKNLLSPVRFSEALSNLCLNLDVRNIAGVSTDTLIEVGPRAASRVPVHEVLRDEARETQVAYNTILTRNTSAVDCRATKSAGRFCPETNLLETPWPAAWIMNLRRQTSSSRLAAIWAEISTARSILSASNSEPPLLGSTTKKFQTTL